MQNQDSFLNDDLYALTAPEADPSVPLYMVVSDAYAAVQVFRFRHEKIKQFIVELSPENLKIAQDKRNANLAQSIKSQDILQIQVKQDSEVALKIVKGRLDDLKSIQKYNELSEIFMNTCAKEIEAVYARYKECGEDHITLEEFSNWFNIIKDAQLRLNTLMFYSNMIESAINDLNKLNHNQMGKLIQKLEEDLNKDLLILIDQK